MISLGLNRAPFGVSQASNSVRSEEHTSELQSQSNLVCRLLLEKKNSSHAWNRGGITARGAPFRRQQSRRARPSDFQTPWYTAVQLHILRRHLPPGFPPRACDVP